MFFYSKPKLGGIGNGVLREQISRFGINVVSLDQVSTKVFGDIFFGDYINNGISLRVIEDAFLVFDYSDDGKGLAILKDSKTYVSGSNVIVDPGWLEKEMADCENLGSSFLSGDFFTGGNMCHVLYDHMCRAFEVSKKLKDDVNYLFYDTTWDWARFFIDKTFDSTWTKFIKKKVVYRIEKLYLFSNHMIPAHFHPLVQLSTLYRDHLRELVSCLELHDASYPEKIYQNRLSASSRNIKNEHDLIDGLSNIGYVSVDTAEVSTIEQLRFFNNAKKIIAPHGAGLSNLLACRGGARVVEVFNGPSTRAYEVIGRKFYLDYQALDFRSSGAVDVSKIINSA